MEGGPSAVATADPTETSAVDLAAVPWEGAVPVGRGSASAAVLDWTVPVSQQLAGDAARPDVVIAAECVWLSELVEPFADAAAALLRPGTHPDEGAPWPV